jgi:tryptophan synthase alpha chain
MPNRITQKFTQLAGQKRKAFIAYITAGDPDLKTTEELVYALEEAGADIIELGVPFSDPIAEGPIIQAASERALKNGTSLNDVLALVSRVRRRSQIPIAFMTYYNLIFRFGDAQFVEAAVKAGVDGVIIPDLPPEEAEDLREAAKTRNFATVFFMAPTTTNQRLQKVADASSGFLYYVSLTGVTGVRTQLSKTIGFDIKRARKLTDKPVCVGFGISTPDHVREVGAIADGVIVGSAIVREINNNAGQPDLVKNVSSFVQSLASALRKI